MCGIIGYIGPQPVVPVLIEGLRRLEYRGYDSAGIAVVQRQRLDIRRSAGKLGNLESRASPPIRCRGTYGLGHTRWATHGRPTEENAHPHRDCTGRIVVVHNGIIENYLELKRELQAAGPQVRHRDRHRGRRAPGRAGVAGRRARRRRPPGDDAAARACSPWCCSRPTTRTRSSPCATARRSWSASATASASSPPTSRRSSQHTRDVVVPRRPGDGGRHPRRRRVHRLRRRRRSPRRRRASPGIRSGREGRLQALHAQGDLRAADGRARHHPRPRLARDRHDLPRRDRA